MSPESSLSPSAPQKGPVSVKGLAGWGERSAPWSRGEAGPSQDPSVPEFTEGACEKSQEWKRGFPDI